MASQFTWLKTLQCFLIVPWIQQLGLTYKAFHHPACTLTSSLVSPGSAPLNIQSQWTTYTSPRMLYHLLLSPSQALTPAWKAFLSPAFCPANSLKFKYAQLSRTPTWPSPRPIWLQSRPCFCGARICGSITVPQRVNATFCTLYSKKVHLDIKPGPLKDHFFTGTCRNFHVKICDWGRHTR